MTDEVFGEIEYDEELGYIGHKFLFYLCSVGIGTFGMMGLMSFFTWLCISTFHDYSIYPIAYPFSIVWGIVCLMAFIALIALWIITFIKRHGKLRLLGISFLLVLAGSTLGYFILKLLDVLSDVFFQ